MSTYYYFKCNKCNLKGGFFSRQAWGWGNFDIIDSFKFLAFHTEHCGAESIRVIDEDNEDFEEEINSEKLEFYQVNSRNFFPASNDWEFMRGNLDKDVDEINALWIERETKGLCVDREIKIKGLITDVQMISSSTCQAEILTENGDKYTIMNNRDEPVKGKKYYVIGEMVSNEFFGKFVDVWEIKILKE